MRAWRHSITGARPLQPLYLTSLGGLMCAGVLRWSAMHAHLAQKRLPVHKCMHLAA